MSIERLRPECYTEEIETYLCYLRTSSEINMYGSGSYLEEEFALSKEEAKACVLYWISTFKE